MRLFSDLARAPFTLTLSAGFFAFYAHGGMLSALVESGFRPVRVTGASAGALVGGCFAAGMDLQQIEELLQQLRREHFWDPAPGLGLLRGERLDAMLRDAMPVTRFEDAQVPFACSVWSVERRSTEVMDGGDLVHAMRASAAFPFLFHPVRVRRRRFLDGGIGDRSAFATLGAAERTLLHHISSRSPWRSGAGSLAAPSREGLVALDLGELPRLGPFSLDRGPEVWAIARERTLRALMP